MKITRDVISDLLPLYHAGECSADTRALVEAYLAEDPQLAARVRDVDTSAWLEPDTTLREPEPETRVLLRAQALLRRRTRFHGAAIFLSAVPLSFTVSARGIEWVLWRDSPFVALVLVTAAAAAWLAYARVRRQLRSTGL